MEPHNSITSIELKSIIKSVKQNPHVIDISFWTTHCTLHPHKLLLCDHLYQLPFFSWTCEVAAYQDSFPTEFCVHLLKLYQFLHTGSSVAVHIQRERTEDM
jgi:hypothetical protein